VRTCLENIRRDHSRPEKGIRLAEFRKICPSIPPADLNSALLELQRTGFLDLNTLADDPSLLTGADRQAAIVISGHPRHVIILK
jgi:hypothetical protein